MKTAIVIAAVLLLMVVAYAGSYQKFDLKKQVAEQLYLNDYTDDEITDILALPIFQGGALLVSNDLNSAMMFTINSSGEMETKLLYNNEEQASDE